MHAKLFAKGSWAQKVQALIGRFARVVLLGLGAQGYLALPSPCLFYLPLLLLSLTSLFS